MRPQLESSLSWLFCSLLTGGGDPKKLANDYRQGHRRYVKPPESRIKTRRRTLTLPSSSKTHRVSSQSGCFLLAKLPYEVRQMIWKECLGGMTFHLDTRYNRHTQRTQLSYIMCRSKASDLCEEACWSYWGSSDSPCVGKKPYSDGMTPRQLLSVLLSCRQVYSEAINHLYALNTFDTMDSDCIQFLPCLLLPQRLNSIRRLQFTWTIPGFPPFPPSKALSKYKAKGLRYKNDVWNGVWQALAKMKGLCYLRVELQVYEEYWQILLPEEEEFLLRPIWSVKVQGPFVLVLPFGGKADTSAWAALPCRIEKMDDDFP